jgi:hypothetical protein
VRIRQQRALRQGRGESEKRSVNLMRIHIDLRASNRDR